jgi:hypothetical protein
MLRNYTAYFVVEVYDGEESRKDAGFVSANSLSEAMGYIEEYYGDELGVVHHLELFDTSMLIMSVDTAEHLLEKIY